MISFINGAIIIERYFTVNLQGAENGFVVFRDRSDFFCSFGSFYRSLRQNINGGVDMIVIYWIGGIISLLLFIYLLVALLKPEVFS